MTERYSPRRSLAIIAFLCCLAWGVVALFVLAACTLWKLL